MRRAALLGLIGLLPAVPAAAQTADIPEDSATTLIYGTIVPVCTVETDTPVAVVQLDTSVQDVATVLYTCNNINGFTRRISSENAGRLVRGTRSIPYLVSQGGNGNLDFSAISLTSLRSDEVPSFPELAIGSSGVLRLQIPTIPSALVAGTYSDTVTIEITPN